MAIGKKWVIVMPAVAAAVIAVVLLSVYLSPALSWNSSIRDRDGDGIPDSTDAFPNDPSRSLPLVGISTAPGNHNWTLTIDTITTANGVSALGIPSAAVRVEAGGSAASPHYLGTLQELAGVQTGALRFSDKADAGALNAGDAFTLGLSEYGPGSRFALVDVESGKTYSVLNLTAAIPSITGGQGWNSTWFRWSFTSVYPSISWNDTEIHISDGQHEASWSPQVRTDDENLSLTATNLGPLALDCIVRSSSPNTMIDAGDNFTIAADPGFDRGTSYRVEVLYDFAGSLGSCTFRQLTPPQAPTLGLNQLTLDPTYATFEFTGVDGSLHWSDVAVLLSDGTSTAAWLVNESDLQGGAMSYADCGIWTSTLNDISYECVVEDLAGNGVVDGSDQLGIHVSPSFAENVSYQLMIVYKPLWESMATINFVGPPAPLVTPVSSLTKSTITNGVKFTFAPFSKDTTWTDITILLSDGTNTKTWSPNTQDLDNGTVAKWNSIATSANLGILKVNLSVIDLAGNGYINQGDFFTLTVGDGQAFSASTTYTVIILYDPTASEVCHLTWVG